MDRLTLFGLFAVTAMLICYAFEDRSRWFVLGFAGSCALGSIYGFLQGAWPFGLVEGIWFQVSEKSLLQAVQKDPEARRAKHRRAEAYLQYVAARRLSGNEAYGSFLAACWSRCDGGGPEQQFQNESLPVLPSNWPW
jgi:hypothetical protein